MFRGIEYVLCMLEAQVGFLIPPDSLSTSRSDTWALLGMAPNKRYDTFGPERWHEVQSCALHVAILVWSLHCICSCPKLHKYKTCTIYGPSNMARGHSRAQNKKKTLCNFYVWLVQNPYFSPFKRRKWKRTYYVSFGLLSRFLTGLQNRYLSHF